MKRALPFIGALLLVLTLTACQSSDHTESNRAMQLKAYSVPPQSAKAIESNLSIVATAFHGSVTQPFPGTLLVYAPRDAQASIEHTIDTLSKASKKAPPPAPLHVHFWVIKAVPGAGKSSPALKPLNKTLSTLESSLGTSHFILDRRASTVATMDHLSLIIAGPYKFAFTPRVSQNGSTQLDVQYSAVDSAASKLASAFGSDSNGINSLHTTVTTTPGQYVVLAMAPTQSPASASSAPAETPATRTMRLLVMRLDQQRPTNG
jgi:hypothetical protein